MATTFTIKQNDTRPKLVTTLSGFGGGATLATATSVSPKMRLSTTPFTVVTLGGTCVITDAANNQITYTWVAADTSVNGIYEIEFQILWNDGGVETVPNDSYNTIIVKDDIA